MKLLFKIVILILNIKTNFFQIDISEIFGTRSFLSRNTSPCNQNETLCGAAPHNHVLCTPLLLPYTNCTKFELIPLTSQLKLKITSGLNRLRNSEAIRAEYPIANMNQLYWDTYLDQMAVQNVYRCDIHAKEDPCHFIGDVNHTIGSTIHFSSQFLGGNKWLAEALHSWYNYSFSDELPAHFNPSTKYSAYTQLLWPTSQYVGCAAAKVFDGLMFVCFYGPKGNEGGITESFKAGPACSMCDIDRGCSSFFEGLCDENGAGYIKTQPQTFWIIITIFSIAATYQGI